MDSGPGRRDNAGMNSSAVSPPHEAPNRPQSLADLFISFTLLSLQGFGGVLGVVQRELVERKQWLTQEEFLEDWAVAQIMPGPNVVNLSLMIGARHFGFMGALMALAGLIALPLAIVLALGVLHDSFADSPAMVGALRGLAAVSAGLIAGAGLKLTAALARGPIPLAWSAGICVAGFVAVALLHLPLLAVLLVLGSIGCVIAWRKLT